jgi:hypothetical protein
MPEIQRSEHVPTKDKNMVDVNLTGDQAPICPRCALGRVHVVGKFDWRRKIAAHCDNPDCPGSDPNDDDKGMVHFLRVMADGTFNRFDGAPTDEERAQLEQRQQS